MSQGRIILDLLVYADAVATNQPLEADFDWRQQWDVTSFAYATDTSLVLTAGAFTKINLPADAIRWLMILTDTTIDVVKSSKTVPIVAPTPPGTWDADNALGTWVEPMNPALVRDGVFFVRGTTTELYIGVPGSTNANVKLFFAY